MKLFSSSIAVLSLGCGMMLALGGLPAAASPANGWYQQYPPQYEPGPEGLRDLVARTQTDIRRSEGFERGDHDQQERCRAAERHLSTFDRHLTKGHYDKDELDHVIADVQGILDHNTLEAQDRDELTRDVQDLRVARARRHR